MKGISVILVLLAAGMLVFGCTYSAQNPANFSAGGQEDSAGSASSGAGQNPSGGGPSAGTQPPVTASGETPAQDLPGKNYSGLIGSGTASRCTVTFKDENQKTVVLSLYFDGKNSMRMEQEDTGYMDCPSSLMIYKGDSSGNGMLYLSCPGHNEEALGQKFGTHEQCQWQSMDIEEQWGGIGSASLGLSNGYSTWPLDYVKGPAYSCQSWTLDASKFETEGFVCD